jgi:putative hydrolase of the HAD superfamily
MDSPSPSPDWFLFDYGMVISLAPDHADWARLQHATGQDLQHPGSPYWRSRPEFDAGSLDATTYWSTVIGSPVPAGVVDRLEQLDAAQWSHLNPATISALAALQSRNQRLALLSNMPAGMASRYSSEAGWAEYFNKLFFSGILGMVKPEQRVFDLVLQELGARPEQVLFVDDNLANIEAARNLGLQTLHFRPRMDLLSILVPDGR